MNLYESIKNNLNEATFKANDNIYIICYGELEIWSTRRAAFDYYGEAAGYCEGSEQTRYINILEQLYDGYQFIDDEGPEKVDSIIERDDKGKRVAKRYNGDPMTHDEAFEYLKTNLTNLNESEQTAGLCVCDRCLHEIESREGKQDISKTLPEECVWYNGNDEEDYFTCDWCSEDFPITDGFYIYPDDKSLNESEEIPDNLKVETCIVEQTGGHIYVAYGKMTDGRYYCLFEEGVSFFDTDIHKYEYEEDHWDENQGDFLNWENEHLIMADSTNYCTYWYGDPEYTIMLKQCIKLDPDAQYIVNDELDSINESEMQSLFDIVTDEAQKNYGYAHFGPREIDEQDIKNMIKDCKAKGTEIEPGKYAVGDYIYTIDNKTGITVNENPDVKYEVKPIKEGNIPLRIKTVKPNYTGGGIYLYTGKLSNGSYFMASDDYFYDNGYFDVLIVNADPDLAVDENQEDIAWFPDWQEEHLVKYLDEDEARNFTKRILNWIITNKPNENYDVKDMERMLSDM